jgi:hypothetical protein
MVWHPRLDHDLAQKQKRDTVRSVAATTVAEGDVGGEQHMMKTELPGGY